MATKVKKAMTQTELAKEIATKCEVSNKAAKLFMSTLVDIAARETKKNGVFVLPGIGRLKKIDRKARMGRNPATGAKIRIPAKKVVKFAVAKAMKDSVVPPKKK